MRVYKIEGIKHYRFDDLRNAGHRGLRECDNDYKEFIRRNGLIKDRDYSYCIHDGDKWTPKRRDSYDKLDVLFIRTMSNYIHAREYDTPVIRKLKRSEKIRSKYCRLEVRGEGLLSDCYFNLDDIGRWFEIRDLHQVVLCDDEYAYDVCYTIFSGSGIFLTRLGLERVLQTHDVPDLAREWYDSVIDQ